MPSVARLRSQDHQVGVGEQYELARRRRAAVSPPTEMTTATETITQCRYVHGHSHERLHHLVQPAHRSTVARVAERFQLGVPWRAEQARDPGAYVVS